MVAHKRGTEIPSKDYDVCVYLVHFLVYVLVCMYMCMSGGEGEREGKREGHTCTCIVGITASYMCSSDVCMVRVRSVLHTLSHPSMASELWYWLKRDLNIVLLS